MQLLHHSRDIPSVRLVNLASQKKKRDQEPLVKWNYPLPHTSTWIVVSNDSCIKGQNYSHMMTKAIGTTRPTCTKSLAPEGCSNDTCIVVSGVVDGTPSIDDALVVVAAAGSAASFSTDTRIVVSGGVMLNVVAVIVVNILVSIDNALVVVVVIWHV